MHLVLACSLLSHGGVSSGNAHVNRRGLPHLAHPALADEGGYFVMSEVGRYRLPILHDRVGVRRRDVQDAGRWLTTLRVIFPGPKEDESPLGDVAVHLRHANHLFVERRVLVDR